MFNVNTYGYSGPPPMAQPGNQGSQGNSPQQSLGATVPEISGHHLGGEATFLNRFDSVTVRYEKRSGKLVIDLPSGMGDVAEQLESLIRNDLRSQCMPFLDSSKIKRHKSGVSQIRFPVRARHEDQATQRVSRFLRHLLEQCEHLGITDKDRFTKFVTECPTLARAVAAEALDFRRSAHLLRSPACDGTLIGCVAEALNFSITEIIDVVRYDLNYIFDDGNRNLDYIAVKTGIIGAFHLALARDDKRTLLKLAPFYCVVPSAVPEKVAEFRRKFPAHADLAFLQFVQREKECALYEKLIRVALREGDSVEAGGLLLRARKRNFSVPPDLSETVIVALCDRAISDDKTAWELYKAHVLAGYRPSEACTQILFQTLEKERLLPGEGPDAPQQRRTAGEWGSRFLTLADAAAEAKEFDAVSRYVAFMTILAMWEKSLLAGLESLAVGYFDVPRVGQIIREKAKAYLEEAVNLQVAVRWQSAMAEAEAWFAARKLAPRGWGCDFQFGSIDQSEPAEYNSFADIRMAIKLAEAWALNKDAPLTRAFEILSYVFEHALEDMEKESVKRELHVAALDKAITEMVRAVEGSPSKEVRDRAEALTDYLLSKGVEVL